MSTTVVEDLYVEARKKLKKARRELKEAHEKVRTLKTKLIIKNKLFAKNKALILSLRDRLSKLHSQKKKLQR